MRIQHNIAALNSWRQLGANQTNSSKNLEKLSSGYRINRAGDDAAGLAISEKMRGQIRGLDMAQKNAQDGISLIQTAEGALNETHSILQRMRELAVQSANGTYQDEVDRENLNKEVDALKSEIDRIATSTHFNKIQLLDGSIGGGSKVSNTAAVDATTTTSSSKPVAGGANAAQLGTDGAGVKLIPANDVAGTAGTSASASITFTNTNATSTAAGTTVEFSYTDQNGDAKTATVTLDEFATTAAADIASAFKDALDADTTLNKLFDVSLNLGVATLTAKGDLAADVDVTFGATATVGGTGGTGTAAGATIAAGADATPASKDLDISGAKAGDTIKIGSTTFELVEAGKSAQKGNVAVAFDSNNAANTTKALSDAINSVNIKGLEKATFTNNTIRLFSSEKSATAAVPDIELGTVDQATSGIKTTEIKGTDPWDGGNSAKMGWKFGAATAAGSVSVTLNDKDGNNVTLTVANIAATATGSDIAKKVADAIKNNGDLKDADGKALYTVEVEGDELHLTANKEETGTFDMTAASISTGAATVKSDTTVWNTQPGKTPDKGGKGAAVELDFSNAQVGDTFRINGKDYEIVGSDDDAPVTSGAIGITYNENKAAMVKDILKETGDGYAGHDIKANGSKISVINQTEGKNSTMPTGIDVGSIGKEATIEVGGAKINLGRTSILNGYNINLSVGDANEASIDKDSKTINITMRSSDVSTDELEGVLVDALKNSGDTALAAVANQVDVKSEDGNVKIGTDASNAKTEIAFKDGLKAEDTVSIGDTTFTIGDLGLEAGENGTYNGADIAAALADKIVSDKFTAAVDGNKLTLVANDGVSAEEFEVAISDQDALTFQIGANGSADQRVSLNVEDMSSAGIGVDSINILTADNANAAIDVIDNAINTVSSTRADLGALQNRLEHTVNNLGTTSENLTAAESRIRDVDMAKEMMEFTKNNILTQAAQAMLAQANQQPQGVLQLLQ